MLGSIEGSVLGILNYVSLFGPDPFQIQKAVCGQCGELILAKIE